MEYCTIEEVCGELHPTLEHQMREHYGQSGEAPDFARTIANHIARAEACVDASLARAFSVPLRRRSRVVASATCKIAAYFAAAAFSEKEEILKDKYETAMRMLENLVRAGTIPGIEAGSGENAGVRYGTQAPFFTPDALEGW